MDTKDKKNINIEMVFCLDRDEDAIGDVELMAKELHLLYEKACLKAPYATIRSFKIKFITFGCVPMVQSGFFDVKTEWEQAYAFLQTQPPTHLIRESTATEALLAAIHGEWPEENNGADTKRAVYLVTGDEIPSQGRKEFCAAWNSSEPLPIKGRFLFVNAPNYGAYDFFAELNNCISTDCVGFKCATAFRESYLDCFFIMI